MKMRRVWHNLKRIAVCTLLWATVSNGPSWEVGTVVTLKERERGWGGGAGWESERAVCYEIVEEEEEEDGDDERNPISVTVYPKMDWNKIGSKTHEQIGVGSARGKGTFITISTSSLHSLVTA